MDETQAADDEISTIHLDIPGKAGRRVKPGDVLGDNYRLSALIGKGGMGYVYRCRHQIIGRDYALKILHPAKVNEQSWMRFQVEGKAIAKLDHPNIVKIFNMGVDGEDCPYYVMELLEGESLETRIEREGALKQDQALELFGEIAGALGYAHHKGIVHRDIKPSNIILEQDPKGKTSIKLVDFGLAKLVDRKSRDEQGLTEAGDVFGSPFYMSPEQVSGADIDERADIYALGCTFYKMLTGRPPFSGESSFKTMFMHQSKPAPTLAEMAPGKVFAQPLEDLLATMLAKKPQDRYQSIDQLLHDVSRLKLGKTLDKTALSIAGQAAGGEEKSPGRGRHIALVAVITLILGGAGTALWFAMQYAPGKNKHTISGTAALHPSELHVSGPMEMFQAPKGLKDPQLDKARENYRNFQARPPKLSKRLGHDYVEFYFPVPAIGDVTPCNQDPVPAQGNVEVINSQPILLDVRVTDHRFTYALPWILEKIDNSQLGGLAISVAEYTDVVPDVTGVGSPGQGPVMKMLDIIHRWKNLTLLHVNECTLNTKALQSIESLPHLNDFALRNSENNGSDLQPYPFVQRLHTLCVSNLPDVDGAIMALRGSKNIVELTLDKSNPSPRTLCDLIRCKNLRRLYMESTKVTIDQLRALSSLTQLEELYLREDQISPEVLVQVPALKNLRHIVVTNYEWTAPQIVMLTRCLPNLFGCSPMGGQEKNFDLIR